MIASLTINMTALSKTSPTPDIQVFYEDDPPQSDQGKKTYATLNIGKINGGSTRAMAMVDTGSDASLIQTKFLHSILNKEEIENIKTTVDLKLKSFSNHPIKVLFGVNLPITNFAKTTQNAHFLVIDSDPNFTPNLLIGMDIIRSFQMQLNFNAPAPYITIHKGHTIKVECIQAFPTDANTCSTTTTLNPGETRPVVMFPHPLSNIQPGTPVLITGSSRKNIWITPTKYIAGYKTRPLMACITNLGKRQFQGKISATFKNIDQDMFINAKSNFEKLKQIKSVRHDVIPHTEHQNIPTLKILENLPFKNTSATRSLQSFLILTPRETKHKLTQQHLKDKEELNNNLMNSAAEAEIQGHKTENIKNIEEIQSNWQHHTKKEIHYKHAAEAEIPGYNTIHTKKTNEIPIIPEQNSPEEIYTIKPVKPAAEAEIPGHKTAHTEEIEEIPINPEQNMPEEIYIIQPVKTAAKAEIPGRKTAYTDEQEEIPTIPWKNTKEEIHTRLTINSVAKAAIQGNNTESTDKKEEIPGFTPNTKEMNNINSYSDTHKAEIQRGTSFINEPSKQILNRNTDNTATKAEIQGHKTAHSTQLREIPAHTATYKREHNPITKAELQKLKPNYEGIKEEPVTDFQEQLLQPNGYEIPCNLNTTIKDIVKPLDFPETHQKYIEDIFINKYPTTIALHGFDMGNISQTLGYYKLELKDNEQLPKFRKIYYTGPQELQQMKDICDFLIRYDVIERCNQRDKGAHLVASAGYLVEKQNKLASARLVVDFKILNQIIKTSPPVIPCVTTTLQQLRNKVLFSSIDLTQAFYSVTLDPDCRHLTRFAVQTGSYVFKNLAMGLSGSPEVFANYAYQMIHMTPKLDTAGKPIYTAKNRVELKDDYMEGVFVFYDDVLITSEWTGTYETSLHKHFKIVEKLIQKLAFHKAKISFEKSKLGKSKIYFLGWTISNNVILPCAKRTNKLLATEFPSNIKQMRSFLGLLNTLRTVLPPIFMPDMAILSQLTSAKNKYIPTELHKNAFIAIKNMLVSTPLFSNIIEPSFKKILFTDSSDKGCYSGVLAQIQTINTDKHIPDHILMDDPVDREIFKQKLCYESVPLYLHDSFILKSKLPTPYNKTGFKLPDYLDSPYLGYTESTVNNSLYISIRSVQHAYGSTMTEQNDLKKAIKEKLKSSIIKYKILSFTFNNNQQQYDDFINNIALNKETMDPNFYLGQIIAEFIKRPLIIIAPFLQQKIFQFNMDSSSPPVILGAYKIENKIIFRPYYQNANTSFDLKEIKNMQIVAFWSKQISQQDQKKAIMEKELYAILGALENFRKLIGRSEVLLITDHKPLFYIFSKPVMQNCAKLTRWGLKMATDYGKLTFRFIKSSHNLADFLTRDYKINQRDLRRIPITDFQLENIENQLDCDKEYSLKEFKDFVDKNQHKLKYAPNKKIISAMTININTLNKIIKPLQALQDRLNHVEILKEQKIQFPNIFQLLKKQPGTIINHENNTYSLQNGLLCIIKQDDVKLLIPASLEPLVISYAHLSMNHAGLQRMLVNLNHYEFPRKTEKIKHLITRCYSCFIVNKSTHQIKLGTYPIPQYIFETLTMDLLENLNPQKTYEHVLLCCCPLTKFIYAFPLKNKKPELMIYNFLYSLYITYNIKYIITDNGPIFNNKTFLSLVHSLNIKKIQIASRHPQSNGNCEAAVKIVKTALKKTLATFTEFSWLDILPIIIKNINTSATKNMFSPLQMLHGDRTAALSQLTEKPLSHIYPLLQNMKTEVNEKTKKINEITQYIQNEIQLQKIETNTKANTHKIMPKFSPGDIVFVKDRSITLGSGRPLRTTFSPDVYVILQVRQTTAIVTRPGDSYPTVYSLEDLKKYSPMDPQYNLLPPTVRDVLAHKFNDWDAMDFETLRKGTTFSFPSGPQLFTIPEAEEPPEPIESTNYVPNDVGHVHPTPLIQTQSAPNNAPNNAPPEQTAPGRLDTTENIQQSQVQQIRKSKRIKERQATNLFLNTEEPKPAMDEIMHNNNKHDIVSQQNIDTLLQYKLSDKPSKRNPTPVVTPLEEDDSNSDTEDDTKQVKFQN